MLPLWTDVDQAVRVVRLIEPAELESLVHLFETVAASEHWQPGDALRCWLHRSVFFGLEIGGQLAGGLQLVLPCSAGATDNTDERGTLPCQAVWPEVALPEPSSSCAHIAMLALAAEQRGQPLLFWRIVIEMWRYCVGEGISTLLIEVTPRVLPLYRRLGWPLSIVGELRTHWGEDCYLCSLRIAEVAAALLDRSARALYARQIVLQAFQITIPLLMVSVPTTPVHALPRRELQAA